MTFRIGNRGRRTALAWATLLTAALLTAGCTSDDPGPVGADIPGDLDLNDPVVTRVPAFTDWGSVAIAEPDKPLAAAEMLYTGARAGYASDILAWYDLAAALGDTFPADQDSIASVALRLFLPQAFTDSTNAFRFDVSALADTFDVAGYPGPSPVAGDLLGLETDSPANVVNIGIGQGWFVDHWQSEEPASLIVEQSSSESAALIPYAAAELQLFTELDLEVEGTVVGPTLTVTFEDGLGYDPVTIAPSRDISSFRELPAQDTGQDETFFLRTHLRVSPWFLLDTESIPLGTRINRAVLRLGLDPDASFGITESLVLSEVPYDLVADADTLNLDALVDALVLVDGNGSLDPQTLGTLEDPRLGFDLTELAQRVANGVLTGPVVLILTAGEDGLSNTYDTALRDPDFYLSHFQFRGPGAATLAPTLEITATEFTGGP